MSRPGGRCFMEPRRDPSQVLPAHHGPTRPRTDLLASLLRVKTAWRFACAHVPVQLDGRLSARTWVLMEGEDLHAAAVVAYGLDLLALGDLGDAGRVPVDAVGMLLHAELGARDAVEHA